MRVVVGSGRNRHVFDVPSIKDKVGREQMAEDMKNFLFRPKLLERST
jgi:hypothetical protein